MSGGQASELGRALAPGRQRAPEVLDYWRTLLPDRFYVELQRWAGPAKPSTSSARFALAAAQDVGVVATNDVCFLARDDFEAHETRVCIGQGLALADPSRPRNYTEQQYLKSTARDGVDFRGPARGDRERCRNRQALQPQLELGRVYLPDFPAGRRAERASASGRARASRVEQAPCEAAAEDRRRPGRLSWASRPRDRNDLQHGLRRLFPDRRRFHRLGERQRDPSRARPRLRRRLARRLLARHHEPRPDRARAAIRAIPEPRARAIAGLRHRLLHRRPRPRDRLREQSATGATASRRSQLSARWRRRPS